MSNRKENKNPNEKWYSVSAIQDHDGCPRRRWFKKTCKLPTEQSNPTIFGDVAHAVCERFQKADDQGRGTDGKPVNLYPAGWMTMKSRFAKEGDPEYTITPEEAVLIQTLVAKAIAEGYLIRQPGRKAELEFNPLIHREGVRQIKFIGFIDLYNPREVLDYKFVKNMNYALSVRRGAKRDIRKSTQMMSYAMIKYLDGHVGDLDLTLLYFVKDFEFPQIQRRSVTVSELEVRQFFNDSTLPSMKNMLALDFKFPKHTVNDWLKVPGANDCNECNFHYGKSCPFIQVCTNYSTVQKYLLIHKIILSEHIKQDNLKGNEMTVPNPAPNPAPTGLMATIEKANAAVATTLPVAPATPVAGALPAPAGVQVAAGLVTPAVVNPLNALNNTPAALPVTPIAPATPAPVPAPASPAPARLPIASAAPSLAPPAEAPAAPQQRAPWYNDEQGLGCPACKDNAVQGYTTTLVPCNVCDAWNGREGKLQSFNFRVVPDANGVLTYTMADGTAVGSVQAVAEPAVKTTVAEPIPATPIAPVQPATPVAPTQISQVVDTSVHPSTARLPEHPETPEPPLADNGTGHLTLLMGCSFVETTDSPESIVRADDIMKIIERDIEQAEGMKVEVVDHFKVLDYVQASAKNYGTQFRDAGATIIAYPTTKSSAKERLVEVLRTLADTVIVPMGL